jgi:hypothetical protein
LQKLENAWANSAGNEAILSVLRKLAAIFTRAMIYNGIRKRGEK